MKKLFVFAISMMAWMTCNAQEYFEGTLKARSYEEHSDAMVKYSKGMMMNGARDAELYIKGMKMAVADKAIGTHTIYDLEHTKFYILFPNIKTAIEMPTAQLEAQTATNATATPTDVYKKLTGMNCRLYKSEKTEDSQGGKTTIKTETYLCEELPVNPVFAPFVSPTGLPYVGMKYVVSSHSKIGIITMDSHTAYEILEVIPGEPDSAVFEIPADYKIVSGSSNSNVMNVYSENFKILKKQKKGKEEKKVIKFDVNEEWDF